MESKKEKIINLLESSELLSYAEIGRRVGCSKETVRYYARILGETGRQRQQKIAYQKRSQEPIKNFKQHIRKQLEGIGYSYCGCCHLVLCLEDMAAKKSKSNSHRTRCKPCDAIIQREWRTKNPEKSKAINDRTNKKQKEYQKEYQKRNKEKILKRRKQRRKEKIFEEKVELISKYTGDNLQNIRKALWREFK